MHINTLAIVAMSIFAGKALAGGYTSSCHDCHIYRINIEDYELNCLCADGSGSGVNHNAWLNIANCFANVNGWLKPVQG